MSAAKPPPTRLRLAATLGIAVAAALVSPPAAAQQGNALTQLRQAFAEARQLEDKGRWAEALDKLKEVAAVKMTPQVRFHIALCEENLGKLVSAMRGFELAGAEATQAGSSAVEVPPAAKQHADALRARVAHLRIEATGERVTSKILVDEAPLAEKELGTKLEVDPGTHVVELRDAAGKTTFSKEVTLAEKGSEKVEVPVDDHPATPPPVKDVPAMPPSPPSHAPAFAVGAIGLAALAGSGVFFGLRASNIAAITRDCKGMSGYTGCSPADQHLVGPGKTYTVVADTLLGVGLAGVGIGTILFFALAPKKQPTAGAPLPAASLQVVPAGTGIKVVGFF